MPVKRSGIELVAKDLFSKVFKRYDKALKDAEKQTIKTAKSITAAGDAQAKAFAKTGKAVDRITPVFSRYKKAVLSAEKQTRKSTRATAKATKKQEISFGALGLAIGGISAGVATARAALTKIRDSIAGVRQVIEDATNAATAHQAAMAGLAISARAANTEFGSIVGTSREWRATVSRLSDEIRVFGERDVAEATARTIDMTKRLGFSAEQMEEVVTRSADLAAKTGVDLTGAVERVTAAMRGEAESAEFLGLTLSETFVKTNAMRLGFEKAWKDMTEAEKAQVRYALFLEQSAGFLGAAAAATDTLAGAQAEANARYEEAMVALGQGMIPLTTQWTKLKAELADKVLLRVAMALRDIIGLMHAAVAGGVAMAKAFDINWKDIILSPVATATDVIAEFAAGTDKAEQAQNAAREAMLKTLKAYRDITEEVEEPPEIEAPILPEMADVDIARVASSYEQAFDAIQDLQADHADTMGDIQKDFAKESLDAEEEYLEEREDLVDDGLDKIESIEEKAAAKREKTIRDAEKDILKEQEDAADDRLKAQRDYEREAARSAEEYELDRIQSEREYEYERKRLQAEGDALAIQELDARYALEQQEAAENQDLQEKQAKEAFDVQLSDMEDASQAVVDELRASLDEQLAEQDTALSEQLDAQREANVLSLAELDARYIEERTKDQERYAESLADAEENYRRQLEAQGEALADQARQQGLGAEEVERILDEFYGDGGVTDTVMAGFYEREQSRISITEDAMLSLLSTAEAMAAGVEEAVSLAEVAMSEFSPGVTGALMDEGGVVTGPANVRVGSGVTEMFIPLGGNPGGGHFSVGWSGNPIPLSGLEKASPESQTAVARALVQGLISSFEEIRAN